MMCGLMTLWVWQMSEADKLEASAPHTGGQHNTCHEELSSKPSSFHELVGACSDVWSDSDEDGSGSSVLEGADVPSDTRSAAPSVGARSSIASTYWRPERSDRKTGLALIDEQ